MQTKATVVSADGKYAIVETERTSACDGCHKAENGCCSVCSMMGSNRKLSTKAFNPIGAVVGDRVIIESNTGRILFYAALVFLLPLLLAFALWGTVALLTENILWQICGGVLGFALTFVGVFFYSRIKQSKTCDVEITEILKEESQQ